VNYTLGFLIMEDKVEGGTHVDTRESAPYETLALVVERSELCMQ
jgi:hypothetical protein